MVSLNRCNQGIQAVENPILGARFDDAGDSTDELDGFIDACEEDSEDFMRFLEVALGYVTGMTTSTYVIIAIHDFIRPLRFIAC